MAKFYPFLSLDCAPTPSTLAQSKERKGSDFAIWQHCIKVHREYNKTIKMRGGAGGGPGGEGEEAALLAEARGVMGIDDSAGDEDDGLEDTFLQVRGNGAVLVKTCSTVTPA